jgi:lipopolysaccharide transport system ATP-binding protein
MSSDIALRATHLSKCYQVYSTPHQRMLQSIVPRLQRVARLVGSNSAPRKYFREFWALRDVNFTARRGEMVGIIGRNGSGKSTLLQMMCGTLTPSEGSTEVKGRVAALLELGSGFNPEFTGRENIYLNGSVLGLTHAEIDDRIDDIIAFADIGDFVDQPIKTYSSGMSMRLAFSVIAHVDANVLIVDEALAVGDAFFQQKCMRWLRSFREKGTVLFCGHDIGAVMNLCDQAIWLEKGEVRDQGETKSVCEAYLASIHAQAAGLAQEAPKKRVPKARTPSKLRAASADQLIQIMEFDPDSASYGSGGATIVQVKMTKPDGSELGLIRGGEEVQVTLRVKANASIERPIVGFHIKDRLGQWLLGENTYLPYRDSPIRLDAGMELEARFAFDLPLLRTGPYALAAAVASGTIDNHVQHHWVHEALVFEVESPIEKGVLVGLPMEIEMHALSDEEALREPGSG